jgi:hypothetical protein
LKIILLNTITKNLLIDACIGIYFRAPLFEEASFARSGCFITGVFCKWTFVHIYQNNGNIFSILTWVAKMKTICIILINHGPWTAM